MTFAEAMKQEIYSSGTSYSEIAALLGIQHNTVRKWCTGEIVPSLEHCQDLDEYFDKPCGYFERIKRLTGDCYERDARSGERNIWFKKR